MKNLFLALFIALLFLGCASRGENWGPSTANQTISSIDKIDFTKEYRDYFSDEELLSMEAGFITKKQIELIGLPANTKFIYFEKKFMVEGNYYHVILPAGTMGKMTKIEGNQFEVVFDLKYPITFVFLLQKDNLYGLGVRFDSKPKISPGILQKFQLTKDFEYVDYLGGKFYFLSGKNTSILQVQRKILEPKVIELKGVDGGKRNTTPSEY